LSLSDRLRAVVEAAEGRKAEDLVVLDLSRVSIVADHFVICSGGSTLQVQAIADAIAAEAGPARVEGYREARWICLDLGDIVVHVFHRDVRVYFDLERLWGDAPRVDLIREAAL
jgi:ribosome-associated protein